MKKFKFILILALAFSMLFAGNVLALTDEETEYALSVLLESCPSRTIGMTIYDFMDSSQDQPKQGNCSFSVVVTDEMINQLAEKGLCLKYASADLFGVELICQSSGALVICSNTNEDDFVPILVDGEYELTSVYVNELDNKAKAHPYSFAHFDNLGVDFIEVTGGSTFVSYACDMESYEGKKPATFSVGNITKEYSESASEKTNVHIENGIKINALDLPHDGANTLVEIRKENCTYIEAEGCYAFYFTINNDNREQINCAVQYTEYKGSLVDVSRGVDSSTKYLYDISAKDVNETNTGKKVGLFNIYKYTNGVYTAIVPSASNYFVNEHTSDIQATFDTLSSKETYCMFFAEQSFTLDSMRFDMYLPKLENEDEDDAELLEKILSLFVRWMGKGLYGLITIVTGQNLSIDHILFDQYANTTLTLFKGDLDKWDVTNSLFYSGGMERAAASTLNRVYGIFTKLAVLAYVVMLVYIGLRILFASTSANKKATAQGTFFNWVKGVAILFLFPYVMRYSILLNHGFVSFIAKESVELGFTQVELAPVEAGGKLSLSGIFSIEIPRTGYMGEMFQQAEDTKRLSYAICWFVMLIQMLQFLVVYLKRLVTVIFLIAIFPLVTITYPIDKLGDGKAQAFGNWFKEFLLEVFIQSFHVINYVLVMGIVSRVGASNWLLMIIGITYVSKGGDILRGLFAQMKGGVKEGGLMQVTKSLVKAKVAINAVTGIKGIATGLFGSDSRIGKGIALLRDGKDGIEAGIAAKVDLSAHKMGAAKVAGTDSTLITDQQVEDTMESLVTGKKKLSNGTEVPLTDDDIRKLLDKLALGSTKQINKAQKNLKTKYAGDAAVQDKLDHAIKPAVKHASSFMIATGAKKSGNAEISQAIKIVIKDRKGGNSLIRSYTNADGVSNDKLNQIRDTHSITIDRDSRPYSADNPPDPDPKSRAARAVSTLFGANRAVNIMDANEAFKLVKEGVETGDQDIKDALEDLYRADPEREEFKDVDSADFKEFFDNFGVNLAVQTINNHDVLEQEGGQDIIDDSIRRINTSTAAQSYIVDGLRVERADLHIGSMPPPVTPDDSDAREYEAIKEKIKIANAGKNQYEVPLSPEEIAYREEKANELFTNAFKDLGTGALNTAVGAAGAAIKVGVGGAFAGAMMGASLGGKEDPITEIMTVVPTAFKVAEGAIDTATTITGARIVADEIIPDALDAAGVQYKHTTSIATNNAAMRKNEEYYENRRIIDAANKEIRENEVVRSRLEGRIRRRTTKKP